MNLFKPALNLARVLGIADDALESLFDSLEVLGILEQWREVPPFQILPRWESPLDLLSQAYAIASKDVVAI